MSKFKSLGNYDAPKFSDDERREMGYRIRNLEDEKYTKQIDLAEYLEIRPNNLRKIENGEVNCKSAVLINIARFFNVSMDYICFGETEDVLYKRIRELLEGKSVKDIKKAENIIKALFTD